MRTCMRIETDFHIQSATILHTEIIGDMHQYLQHPIPPPPKSNLQWKLVLSPSFLTVDSSRLRLHSALISMTQKLQQIQIKWTLLIPRGELGSLRQRRVAGDDGERTVKKKRYQVILKKNELKVMQLWGRENRFSAIAEIEFAASRPFTYELF